ncbi:rCG38692, isoform CRA_c [Rattus norvegicus]|nr:rCG38692, isoform CRA_c [Rattus norvegicus]
MVCRKARCAWERMLKPSWPGPSPQRQRPQASSQLPAIWSPGRCTCQDSSSPPRPDQDHLPSVFKKIFCQGGLPAPLLHLPQRGLPQPMAWELGHHGASDSLRSHPVQRTRRIQTHPGPLLWLSWRSPAPMATPPGWRLGRNHRGFPHVPSGPGQSKDGCDAQGDVQQHLSCLHPHLKRGRTEDPLFRVHTHCAGCHSLCGTQLLYVRVTEEPTPR